MNGNHIIQIARKEVNFADGFVKLYARGKIGLLFSGDARYWSAAEECFRKALDICVGIKVVSFAKEMRNRGVPEQAIHEFLNNCTLVDEVYFNPTVARS